MGYIVPSDTMIGEHLRDICQDSLAFFAAELGIDLLESWVILRLLSWPGTINVALPSKAVVSQASKL